MATLGIWWRRVGSYDACHRQLGKSSNQGWPRAEASGFVECPSCRLEFEDPTRHDRSRHDFLVVSHTEPRCWSWIWAPPDWFTRVSQIGRAVDAMMQSGDRSLKRFSNGLRNLRKTGFQVGWCHRQPRPFLSVLLGRVFSWPQQVATRVDTVSQTWHYLLP